MSKSNQPEGEAAGGSGPSSDHGGRGGRGRGGNRGGYNNGHGNCQAHGSIRRSTKDQDRCRVSVLGPGVAESAMDGIELHLGATNEASDEAQRTEEAAVTSDKQEFMFALLCTIDTRVGMAANKAKSVGEDMYRQFKQPIHEPYEIAEDTGDVISDLESEDQDIHSP
ncbi:hypothetical protein FGLOB1_8439 [Fusarium globosum]|uniref:Uncharacterized protein n=1 Tax=Fusarium globosum TaxID=78864 RepID=A0A8H6D571_9HYPO|nr:hypothetical protein FGLOB1_8439 [Fusarium globosum]